METPDNQGTRRSARKRTPPQKYEDQEEEISVRSILARQSAISKKKRSPIASKASSAKGKGKAAKSPSKISKGTKSKVDKSKKTPSKTKASSKKTEKNKSTKVSSKKAADSKRGKPSSKTSKKKQPEPISSEQEEEEEDEDQEGIETEPSEPIKFNPEYNAAFASQWPDPFSRFLPPFQDLDENHKHSLERTLSHPGSVACVTFSPGGEFMASVSTYGMVKIWDSETWECLSELKDKNEPMIEEFYRAVWSADGRYIITGGKRKNRKKWSAQDSDNFIEPCPLKVFDILTGEVVRILKGHDEEVYSIKKVEYKGKQYLLTASEEGFLIKWPMNPNYDDLRAPTEYFPDMSTCVILDVTLVPNCGSRYFLTSSDTGMKLFDFDSKLLLQQWGELYTHLCNCIKFVPNPAQPNSTEFLLLTRGTENYMDENEEKPVQDHKAILHKLSFPKSEGEEWSLVTLHKLTHPNYFTKSWLAELTSNGRFAFIPSGFGTIFVYDLKDYDSKEQIVFHDMIVEPDLEWDYEVLDIAFHPTKSLLVSGGDDGIIRIFSNDIALWEKNQKEKFQREKLAGKEKKRSPNNNSDSASDDEPDEIDIE